MPLSYPTSKKLGELLQREKCTTTMIGGQNISPRLGGPKEKAPSSFENEALRFIPTNTDEGG